MPDACKDPAGAERAFAARLRQGERFSHLSAARIWGIPLPKGAPPAVHLAVPPGTDRRRHRAVVGHTWPGETRLRGGLPVSAPIDAFLELAAVLRLDDLVAAGDWLVHAPRIPRRDDPRPLATPASLISAAADRTSWHIRRAREAAALIRCGAESPPETRLRLLLQRVGLPEPTLCAAIHDAAGDWIGYFDLVWPDARVAVEYDGDQHRTDTRQYERDILRFDRATLAGWTVVRVRAAGLRPEGRADTLARVRTAFRLHTNRQI